jgi:hypothetical protein
MGDEEFENFLQDKEGPTPECQKRLLFDIIQQKLCNSTDLIGIYSELYSKFPKKEYEVEIDAIKEISKEAFEQLDYLMSVVLEEMDTDGEDD